MDFNTLLFLAFFAGTAVLNYVFPRILRPYFLLVASYLFYMYKPENAALVALLAGATIITWAAGLAIGTLKSKPPRVFFLVVALLTCGGFLFFYKYFGFFDQARTDILAFFGGQAQRIDLNLIAPLGLSYFTFASLGYVIDVYRRKYPPEKNILKYALFVSFFPCIFTGPIERYDHLMKQLKKPRRFSYDRCAGGAFRMAWGYFKKLVLADNLAVFVSAVFATPENSNGPQLVLASLLFSMQIFLDFSGCCDIAIGGARILGVDLLENFNSPFLSTTFSQLWTRWHMSLTGWFRDYLYIPLGGSRRGKVRHYLNLIIVFLVSGLWHGAAWGYVLWGFFCGVVSVAEKLLEQVFKPRKKPVLVIRILQCLRTYVLFTLCVVFFFCALYNIDWQVVFTGFFGGWEALFSSPATFGQSLSGFGLGGTKLVVLVYGIFVVMLVESQGNVASWIRKQSWTLRWPMYYALGCAILFYGAFGQSIFIYQQY